MRSSGFLTLTAALAFAALMASTTESCGRGDSTEAAVPRPEGFPRIERYDSVYHPLDSVPVRFEVNDSAVIVPSKPGRDGDTWVTLAYPRYGGARLFLTFTPTTPASLPTVLDNRAERMALNTGGARSELIELVSDGGFSGRLMTTRSSTVTPLQFLASDPHGSMVVSGALFIGDAAEASSPDSLTPVVDAVRDDLLHALKHLSL